MRPNDCKHLLPCWCITGEESRPYNGYFFFLLLFWFVFEGGDPLILDSCQPIGDSSVHQDPKVWPKIEEIDHSKKKKKKKKERKKENRSGSLPVRQREWSTPATSTIAFDIGRDLLYNCKSWPWLKSTLTLSDSLLPFRPVVQHHFSKKSLPNIYRLFMQLQPSWTPGINYWSRLLSAQYWECHHLSTREGATYPRRGLMQWSDSHKKLHINDYEGTCEHRLSELEGLCSYHPGKSTQGMITIMFWAYHAKFYGEKIDGFCPVFQGWIYCFNGFTL